MRRRVSELNNDSAVKNQISEALRDMGVWTDSDDEFLINIIEPKQELWNYKLHASQRTKLKKAASWFEVFNTMGGEVTSDKAKKRWQYLRDCYVKAKKQMEGYVPSGSAASNGHPIKSGFRFHERMRFMKDVTTPEPTTSSLKNMPQRFPDPSPSERQSRQP